MNVIGIKVGCISNAFPLIGYQGENEHTRIVFDAGEIFADYPNAIPSLAIKPPVGDVYPKIVTREGNSVIWDVTAADVANQGNGAYQLTFTNGTVIAKSFVGVYAVHASIIGEGKPPEPVEDWIEEATAMLEAFANMTASAATLPAGDDATAELSEADGHKVLLFGIPKGETGNGIASCVLNGDYTLTITFTDGTEYTTPSIRGAQGEPGKDGEDGFSPVVSVSEITGGHRIIITDAEGDHTFDVLNGEDGFDPVVVVATITGGHRITVTDASGSTSFDVMDGVNGTDGTSAYVWIRYSATEPTQDSDMKTTPDAWMGVYSGSSVSAPAHYTDYSWYNIKGDTGEVSEAELTTALAGKADIITDSVTNQSIATFSDGGDGYPMEVTVSIEPIQSGTGDPSPDNIRPITGWTGCNVHVADGENPHIVDNVYHISWQTEAGTVYGGTLKINKDGTCVLTVDRTITSYDNTSGFVMINSGIFCLDNALPNGNTVMSNKSSPKFVCNKYIENDYIANSSSMPTKDDCSYCTQSSYKRRLWIKDSSHTTLDSFNTALSIDPIVLVVWLATPVTYNLIAEQVGQILSLKGTNNVWADTGNASVDYSCDTKLYVDKHLSASQSLMELIITANREASMKATKAYASGDLLIVNGTLYKASTSIANGATLTVGTNVTATTIASELALLA